MSRNSHNSTRSRRGFTLVELMIVVVIMGVLAAVAIMSYGAYVRRARTAEAAGLLANIKASQESYRSEFGMYCNVNDPQPSEAPRSTGREWDPDEVDPAWHQLGFSPDNKIVRFQLDTIAGTPGNDGVLGSWTSGDLSIGIPTDSVSEFTQDHWFAARALGNQDDDSEMSVFWIHSRTTKVGYANETE